jgi:hypothetical protein
VTTTTHKTLRGPRGGLVLCSEEFAEAVDKGCPLVIGGPLPHVMAAKAVALREANSPEFRDYASGDRFAGNIYGDYNSVALCQARIAFKTTGCLGPTPILALLPVIRPRFC